MANLIVTLVAIITELKTVLNLLKTFNWEPERDRVEIELQGSSFKRQQQNPENHWKLLLLVGQGSYAPKQGSLKGIQH